MKIVAFNSLEKIGIEEGTVLRFLASDYRKDYKDYTNVFEVIGMPVPEAVLTEVEFK